MTLLFVTALLSIAALVLRREYSDWAARLARWMVRTAARFHCDRHRMQDEWLAELATVQSDDSEAQGLTFGTSLFLRYALSAPVRIIDPKEVLPITGLLLMIDSPRAAMYFIGSMIVTSIWLERRHLRRLPPGETLQANFVVPAKSRKHFMLTFAPTVLVILFGLYLAATHASVSRYLGVALYASWWGLLVFHPPFVRAVTVWRRNRFELLDPRSKHDD